MQVAVMYLKLFAIRHKKKQEQEEDKLVLSFYSGDGE